jgi:hypothetical protein
MKEMEIENKQSTAKIVLNKSSQYHSTPSASITLLLIDEKDQKINIGIWTKEETHKLISATVMDGKMDWKKCSDFIGTRTARQCRDKWSYSLQPDEKKTGFEKWEDQTIIKMQQLLGNKWSMIANYLPGRTSNSVKNRWHSHLSKDHKNIS